MASGKKVDKLAFHKRLASDRVVGKTVTPTGD